MPYLQNRMCASRNGPARPRAIGCEGAGVCAIASQERQENFSRTCWITFQRAGTCSSVSVTSSPILRSAPLPRGHAAGAGWVSRGALDCVDGERDWLDLPLAEG